ncbi:ephexin-1 isoform X1 [Pygocentrus nattereri]|uniref:ephexin-1 isoform X1 n=1 Tax=Pygocentrus nattereri TaxID=42514 RepID=UPI000814B204|nr:ephexin-1 isoform X1 [Pygocentrus nattereri]
MGTDEHINTKPQLPPKPQVRRGKWHRATEVIQKKDAEEAGCQIWAKQSSMPVGISSRHVSQWPENEKGLESPSQNKPIPKPRRHKPPLSQPADDSNPNVSSEASLCAPGSSNSMDNSSKADSVPSACPRSCPCMCHHASKHGPAHGPQHEDNHSEASMDKEYHNLHLDNRNLTDYKTNQRVPPNIPVPPRPLPKEPRQIIITDVGETTDPNIKEGVYVDIDRDPQSDKCNLTSADRQMGNMTAPSCTVQSFPPKPVPALRTINKERVTPQTQTKHRDTERLSLDNLRNELCRLLSTENQENGGDISKPRTMKNMIVQFIFSKSLAQSSTEQSKASQAQLPSQNKTHTQADKTTAIPAEEPARKKGQKQSLIQDKTQPVVEHMVKHLFDSSATESIQIPEQYHEQSTATLPSSALEVQGTGNSSQAESKGNENNSQSGVLESFWQERLVVRDRGILIQLTKEEIQLQESIYEVATSEQSYLDGLTVAVDHFQECPALKSAISPRDQKSLFSGISRIREISQNFMDAMVQKLGSSLLCDVICDVVHHYATGPFGAYVDYIRNMPYQKQTLLNLRKESPQVVEVLTKLEDDPRCNRLPLYSFLCLPFQRIPRLKILMETVLKRTAPGSDVQASAERALKEISKVVEACNREVGKMKQMEELVLIANKAEFECKALPLVSSSRWLVKNGDLAQLSQKETVFGRKKLYPVHLFLFNDLLLVATRKGPDRYLVHDHVHRSLVEVTEGPEVDEDLDGCDLSRVFQLAVVKNHRGTLSHYLLQASTQAERNSWLDVLRGQRGEEDGVYEEWDCPQVCCIEVYHAQQPGELSLKRGDIINIIQKSTDGYMEGRRLYDGERGRFPAACVEEISTEHVQRRHLRERYRVLQAATRLIKRYSPPKDYRTTLCFK